VAFTANTLTDTDEYKKQDKTLLNKLG